MEFVLSYSLTLITLDILVSSTYVSEQTIKETKIVLMSNVRIKVLLHKCSRQPPLYCMFSMKTKMVTMINTEPHQAVVSMLTC